MRWAHRVPKPDNGGTLACRLIIGARWERCGRDQGGNHVHRHPIASGFQTRSLEQRAPDRPEEPAQTEGRLAIRARLQLERRARDLALFNLAVDSKLKGCDLVRL